MLYCALPRTGCPGKPARFRCRQGCIISSKSAPADAGYESVESRSGRSCRLYRETRTAKALEHNCVFSMHRLAVKAHASNNALIFDYLHDPALDLMLITFGKLSHDTLSICLCSLIARQELSVPASRFYDSEKVTSDNARLSAPRSLLFDLRQGSSENSWPVGVASPTARFRAMLHGIGAACRLSRQDL